jgi:pimeloyl-ACP methyl ester carboxylesterase
MVMSLQWSCQEKKATDQSKTAVVAKEPATAVSSRTQYAEVNHRKIAFRSVGEGEPMILCQRFRGNLDDWDPAFLDELAQTYRVITFDYTGLGSSTGNPHTTITGFASDVKDLANFLGLKKMILGGWSFGGWVAQTITAQDPELVSQTILIGTRPPGKPKFDIEEIFKQTAYKPVNDLNDEIILFFEPISELSRKLGKESHGRIAARSVDIDPKVRLDQLQFYGKAAEDYTTDNLGSREKLTTTAIPILVISGDHEICFPPENWFELNRKLPTTQIVVIPQSGHGPQHQYPRMVTDYIRSFIEKNKQLQAAN